MSALSITVASDDRDITGDRISLLSQPLGNAQRHVIIRTGNRFRKLSSAVQKRVHQAFTAGIPEVAIENALRIHLNAVSFKHILICLNADLRVRMPGFSGKESNILHAVFFNKMRNDCLLRQIIVNMNGRKILALLIDEKHFPLIVPVEVFFDALNHTIGLDRICHYNDRVELIIGHESEDRRLTDTSGRSVLVFDKHRKNTDVIILLESLIQQASQETSVVKFFRLAKKHSDPFSTFSKHTSMLEYAWLIRNKL